MIVGELFLICTHCFSFRLLSFFPNEWIVHLSSSSTDEGQQMTAKERVRSPKTNTEREREGQRDRVKTSFLWKKWKRDCGQAFNGGKAENLRRMHLEFRLF